MLDQSRPTSSLTATTSESCEQLGHSLPVVNASDWQFREIPAAILQEVRSHCIPILCTHLKRGRDGSWQTSSLSVCGGSALLWQSRSARFIVTAYHVWAELRRRLLADPAACRMLIFHKGGPV